MIIAVNVSETFRISLIRYCIVDSLSTIKTANDDKNYNAVLNVNKISNNKVSVVLSIGELTFNMGTYTQKLNDDQKYVYVYKKDTSDFTNYNIKLLTFMEWFFCLCNKENIFQ